jgi:hypothetical protein
MKFITDRPFADPEGGVAPDGARASLRAGAGRPGPRSNDV